MPPATSLGWWMRTTARLSATTSAIANHSGAHGQLDHQVSSVAAKNADDA